MELSSEIYSRLKTAGVLSKNYVDLGQVPTDSYSLNRVISGQYNGGVPIGGITQIKGESSTGKTLFLTSILKNSQKLGYHTILIDSENAFNPKFAKILGLDDSKLIYAAPETVEDSFKCMESLIQEIRETDPTTPIVIGYDSLAVSPVKKELEVEDERKSKLMDYNVSPTEGAIRAKIIGSCLRKINTILKKHRVALVIINQLRSKINIMYGNPNTLAAGGRALEYYVWVDLETYTSKATGTIKGENDQVIGIRGRVKNTKNKITKPYQECEFELIYDVGLSPYFGLLEHFVQDGLIKRAGGWYEYNAIKFRGDEFPKLIASDERFSELNKLLKA